MKEKISNFYEKFFKKRPTRLILFMYLATIFIATILLMLPIASVDGVWTNPIDAFFTAVSAVCVTGLVTVTTATHWTIFGKIIIIILIQLGGLGVMTAASVVALLLNKKVSISSRLNLSEEKNALTIEGIVRIIKFVIFSTLFFEAIGAILLSFTFVPDFGVIKGVAFSIFHAISAYCNAGFDIIGGSSLLPYATSINVSIVVPLLIIIGGLGYPVFTDLLENKFEYRKYTTHTKLVLTMTGILLLVPALMFLILEFNNPLTLGKYNIFEKLLTSFFQSTTLRTAGFFTIEQQSFVNASAVLMLGLMFIGGSPAGTAGGFKTTSFAALLLITRSNIRKEKSPTLYNTRLPENVGLKVTSILTISILWIILAIFLLSISDPQFTTLDVAYEVISAYATVGLTRGITPTLSAAGKLIISVTMLFGKVGPLSMILAFAKSYKAKSFREREENILIG